MQPLSLGDTHHQTILVTGAAGFIGSQVAELLLAQGCRVIGVDSLNNAYDVCLKQWRLAQLESRPGFEFFRLDIADRAALRAMFQSIAGNPPSAVINLAARAGVRESAADPWVYFEANVTGTLNLLELCRSQGIRKFVLSSSSSLYGAANSMPWREDQPTDSPFSPYAASKKAAELLCYTYHHLYGIDVTVYRYFSVYGPAGRPDMFPFRLVQWINEGRPVIVYGDGRQQRDFTYVQDIARGTLAGLTPLGYELINLGSDRPVMVRDAIELVERLSGRRAQIEWRPANPADLPATWAGIGKAERLLGWRPQIGFEEGMASLVEWYQANRSWARDILTI
jgi:nucleoside-diphosphate-sugar epimerase